MAVEWRRFEVADLLAAERLFIGDGYRAKNSELSSIGIPFARAGNINDGFRFEDADHFPIESLNRVGNKIARPGDVVFTSKGTVGRFALVQGTTPRFVYSPQLCFWRSLDPELIWPPFLYYWMYGSEFYAQYKGVAGQTDMAEYVSLTDQRRMHITLPDSAEQRAIAHILGSLDDKIELNRRMNETLEAMARALFQSWFVDFDPVRARAEGRQPPGMDPATAALFPRAFQDSERGPIPKGWQHAPVRQVCEGLFDGPHATPPESDSGAVFLGIKNFGPTSLDLTSVRYIAEDDWPHWTKRVEPRHEDIVFTYEATLGFFALIPPGLRCCLGRRTALVRPRRDARDSHYLFHWFVAPPFQEFLRAHRQPGSTVDRIWLKDFPEYPVLQPPRQLVYLFEDQARPLWSRIHANQSEMATLAEIRDALLPRLLSGELSVGKAMKAVEAIA
jgi:type I restriction enzyme S subunit